MRQNFSTLTALSACDNVLLEHRLAIELRERGMIERIYPIMIGDYVDSTQSYTNYFASGCHPDLATLSDVVVGSVEAELLVHLDKESLGSPCLDVLSIADIVNKMTENQGCLIEGEKAKMFDNAVEIISKMVEDLDTDYSSWKKLMSEPTRAKNLSSRQDPVFLSSNIERCQYLQSMDIKTAKLPTIHKTIIRRTIVCKTY